MGVASVGRGLGMVAAVVPGGVVTPAAIVNVATAETFRITSENGDSIKTEAGDFLARHFYTLATEAGDRIVTEDQLLIEV